jgi:hypothetical protein
MKISESGAPILGGIGLKTVRERIEQRFAEAREAGPSSLVPVKPKHASDVGAPHSSIQLTVISAAEPLRSLAEIAAPLLLEIRAKRMLHHRKDGAVMWDIGEAPEVSDAELPKLMSDCEVSLGFKKSEPKPETEKSLSSESEPESILKRNLFQGGR